MPSTRSDQQNQEATEHHLNQSADKPFPLARQPLKLKLINKGGMWEPAKRTDVNKEIGDDVGESIAEEAETRSELVDD